MTDWLLATLLATSALIALVLLVREPVRKWFGSRVTYGLWLIPAARLFMPTLTHVVERTIPAPAAIPPFAEPLVSDQLWMARVAPTGSSPIDQAGGWPTLFVAAWLAVATTLFVNRMIAYGRDRRTILAASVPVARIGAVRIVRSPEIASPVALGIFDRLIAVPSDFERLYDARERRLVLEHELAHHHSGDLVANLFAFVLLCLQWFNPLAWVAHAAFRFDQEAACDARVLDEATRADRGDYGRAIAKAASGRALLFASALDRRNTLQRRLQSMLCSSNPTKRLAGRLMVVSVVAVALPLTASRAVQYVDLPTPAAAPASTGHGTPAVPAVASISPVTASAATIHAARARESALAARPAPAIVAAATTSASGDDGDFTISGDMITIDGKTKRWEDLTPAEKVKVRNAVAKAREALAKAHVEQARIKQSVAALSGQIHVAQLQQNLANTQASIAAAVRRMDQRAREAPASGRDPVQLETALRATLQAVQAVDLHAAQRALATVDRAKIAASVAGAQESMRKAQADLARIQARIDADQHP
jgi:bla regulator protein blaR1